MTRVLDKNGNVVEGLSRESGQGLSVCNPAGHAKYLAEKQRAEDVERLKQDVSEMKSMLTQILKAING